MSDVKLFASFLFVFILTLTSSRGNEISAQVFRELNLARTSPALYADIIAQRLGGYNGIEGNRAVREAIRFLKNAEPLPPLIFSEGISQGALSHVREIGPSGARGHRGPDGSMPWDRIAKFGQWAGASGENISYGKTDARKIVMSLIVDDGVWGRGHRKNIFNRDYRFTGIATGHHARYVTMCVMDFAGYFDERPSSGVARADSKFAPRL